MGSRGSALAVLERVEMTVRFDRDLWRWELTSGPWPGPGRYGTVELLPGVLAHADLATAELVEVSLDAVDGNGSLPAEVRVRLRGLLPAKLRDGTVIAVPATVADRLAEAALAGTGSRAP